MARFPLEIEDIVRGVFIGNYSGGSRTTTPAMDSAFTYGSAGDCIGVKFIAPATTTLTDVYFYLDSKTGSPGQITCHLSNAGSSVSYPGTSITSVNTAEPSGAGWVKFTFSTSNSVTQGVMYWVVIGAAGADGSNYYNFVLRSVGGYTEANSTSGLVYLYTSTSGFSGAGSSQSPPQAFLLKFASGDYLGHTLTLNGTDTSNTLERGFKFGPLDADIYVRGACGVFIQNHSTIQILDAATAPGGSVSADFNGGAAVTLDTSAKLEGSVLFPESLLRAGKTYRLTLRFSGAGTSPGYQAAENVTASNLADIKWGLPGAGKLFHTIDNGASGWTDFDNDTDGLRTSRLALLVSGTNTILNPPAPLIFGA